MVPNRMFIVILFIAMVIIIIVAGGYLYHLFFSGAMNPPLRQSTLTIGNHTWTVEIASTTAEKALGLSGRDGLSENDGMLFLFDQPATQNFWMKDMQFSLDMIWISGDKVAGFAQDAAPQPGAALWNLKIYTSPDDVDKVLEVNAGMVQADNIQIGNRVVFVSN